MDTMEEETRREHNRLTALQSFQAAKLVEANGKMEGEFFVYNPGWSDQRVADEVGCDWRPVAYRRTALFGPLRKAPTGLSVELREVEKRIETMEVDAKAKRVKDFEQDKRLEALEKAINILLSAPNRDAIPREKLEELRKHFSGQVHPSVRPF